MNIDFVIEEIQKLKERSLFRECKTIESAQDTHVLIDGRYFLSFCSNNYLGLANHPAIEEAAIDAIRRYGWGAGASRLVSGNMTLHHKLEKEIAEFKGTESSLLFPTGYMANVGAICSLVSRGDIVISDKLNHASIIDACRQSGATFRVYLHNNMKHLESLLQKYSGYRRKLLVTDSVFSMDGDIAPLPEIVPIARRYGAMIMIDDAHATGVFGTHGRGITEYFGLEGKIDIIMGSLSKAVGGIGGFIAGKTYLIDYLRNKARPFIYTTALPPAACAASLAGLRLIQENTFLINKLWENIGYLRSRLSEISGAIPVRGPIVPLIVGSAWDALEVSGRLYEKGILLPAIRPPTVPHGTSRLRISLMATHKSEDIDRLMEGLTDSWKIIKGNYA